MPKRENEELESHLADRLKETRDVASFSRRQAAPQPGETEVEHVLELPEHLGGRKIADKFIRGGKPTPPPTEKPKKLEHHLESLLSEVQDSTTFSRSGDDPLEAYRRRRKEMGGS